MNRNELPGAGRAPSPRWLAAVPLLALGVALGVASADVRAAWVDAVTTGCLTRLSDDMVQPWTIVNPLTSSTPVGTPLMARNFSLHTEFAYKPATVPHTLVIAGHWSVGPLGSDSIAPTNIDGIGLKWMTVSGAGETPLPFSSYPTALAADKLALMINDAVGSGSSGRLSGYRQYLVLTKPANLLPPGALQVTRIADNREVKLYARDFLTAAAPALGTIVDLSQATSGTCSLERVYDSTGIVNLGGGPPPPIPNKCDVVANQIIPVNLGTFSVRDFPNANSTSTPVPFAITLNNCTANAKPTISFRDKSNKPTTDKTILQLYAPGGQSLAEGFGIIMTNRSSGARIAFDNPNVATKYVMTRSGDTATIQLQAQYLRTGTVAEMKAGYAGGSAEFTFTFP